MKHWSNYWSSSKTLNSFAESDASQGYKGAIKNHWFKVFSTLKPNSRIVDIGCGNGALACLAVEYSNNHNLNFEVHGIDAADINPLHTLQSQKESIKLLKQLSFHPGTPAEKLPFKAESVDIFISQFGFEYTNVQQALEECTKALTADGVISLMSHHNESFISKDTMTGAKLLNEILHSSPLFIQIDLLLDIASQVKASGQYHTWKNNPYNQSISNTIKWILDTLKTQFSDDIHKAWLQDIINRVLPTLQNIGTTTPQELRTYLAQQYTALEDHRIRLEDQLKAMFTKNKLDTLEQQVKGLGFTIQAAPFMLNEQPFAWSININ